MAKTTTKKTTETEVVEEVKTSAPAKDTTNLENEALKKQVTDMEQKMAMLMQMLSNNMSTPVQTLNVEKEIEVISLIGGTLFLTTTGENSGQKYTFKNQFDSLMIPESDLKAICRSMHEAATSGLFYIADPNFIREAHLTTAYRNMMDKNELMSMFNKPANQFMAEYNACSEGQKKIIIDMVVTKKMNGENIDANILVELGKNCGRDLMNIELLANLME